MFWKNIQEESIEVKILNEVIKDMEKVALETKKDHEKDLENIKKDHEIFLRRKDTELDVKIGEKVEEYKTKIAKLELENGNYKKEVEILTKAFENLGFDVKDMKDILNKLVDGIVSKNTIQLVK